MKGQHGHRYADQEQNPTSMKIPLKKPLKTVLLLQDLEFGGTQRYATHLLKHLDRELFDLRLWVLRGGEDMLPIAKESLDRVTFFCQDSWVTPQALVRLFIKIRSNTPDIIYTLTAVPNIWGRLFAYILGVPVIVSSWRGRKEQQFESLLWRMSNRIVCNATALKAFLTWRHSVDPARAEVVPNGVDTEFFTPDDTQRNPAPTVLYLGRLARIKDPMTALKAFHVLSERLPEARMIIMGNGRLWSALETYVHRTCLGNRVAILSGSRDVRPYLRKSWLLVLSSISEGLPNVILEAMACGLPVVATAVGGNPEVVRQDLTGLLVPSRQPEIMADAMEKILVNHDVRNTMGINARTIAEREYSISAITAMTEKALIHAAYDAVLRKGRTDLLTQEIGVSSEFHAK